MRQDVIEGVTLRPAVENASLAHLSWRINQPGDWVIQLYVNGQLHDVFHNAVRSTWLPVDRGRPTIVQLAAVPLSEAWGDHSHQLNADNTNWTTDVHLAVLRDESLDIASQVRVLCDGQLMQQGPLWDASDPRGGFGGLFGIGVFGLDGATAPGHGLGEMGIGPFGAENHAWRWHGLDLTPTAHELTIQTTDKFGQVTGTTESIQVVIQQPPPGPAQITIDATGVVKWTAA